MFDLVMKLAKKRWGKSPPEEPLREWMRLQLELESVQSTYAMSLEELEGMNPKALSDTFGEETGSLVAGNLSRMRQLWKMIPEGDRVYLGRDRELVEYQEFSEDLNEKEYLSIFGQMEALAFRHNLSLDELINLETDEIEKLLGLESAKEFWDWYRRGRLRWDSFTLEQKERNLPKRFNRLGI